MEMAYGRNDLVSVLNKQAELKKTEVEIGKKASSLSADEQKVCYEVIKMLNEKIAQFSIDMPANFNDAFVLLKKDYDELTKKINAVAKKAGDALANAFAFCEQVFADGQEMLIFVTELTISQYTAYFISRFGCKAYFAHNKELLFYERQKQLISKIEQMEQLEKQTLSELQQN